jgi:hypothetical protein
MSLQPIDGGSQPIAPGSYQPMQTTFGTNRLALSSAAKLSFLFQSADLPYNATSGFRVGAVKKCSARRDCSEPKTAALLLQSRHCHLQANCRKIAFASFDNNGQMRLYSPHAWSFSLSTNGGDGFFPFRRIPSY